MAELQSYVCPNCGANTTNAENCEYCGSLLVRFVEKGIDLSQTSYTDNSEVFPGLITELKKNLKLQEENKGDVVTTDINWMIYDTACAAISIHSASIFQDDTPMNLGAKAKGLIISFHFDIYADNSQHSEYNGRMDARLKEFKQLKSFPLFTSHYGPYVDEDGEKRLRRGYAIHFGEDAEGAARLISEVLIKVEGLKPTDSYDIFTNVGVTAIQNARNAWDEAHGFVTVNENPIASLNNVLENLGVPNWVYVLILLFVLIAFSRC